MKKNDKHSNQYEVNYSPLNSLDELEKLWNSVKNTNQNRNFFLSWTWMQTWIQTYGPKAHILSAKFNDEIVSIALLTEHTEKRRNIISSRQLRFHQTGNENEDQIWVEYNGFLENEEHYPNASLACIKHLYNSVKEWDEIVISMIENKNIGHIIPDNCNKKYISRSPSYMTDLQYIKENHNNYLASISSNTRYQINRSIKLYNKEKGEIQIEVANTTEQAIDFFNEAAPLHLSRWPSSGFANNLFIAFHHNLIRAGSPKGEIDLIRVTAGGALVGIVYNFIYKDKVHFYLQALTPNNNPKLKPGLVIHSILIQHYLDNNKKIYDFMGGDSQYKRSLANRADDMSVLILQRPKLIFSLENLASRLKSILKSK